MMRYSEIPHDFSSDSLHFAEMGEDQIYRSLRDESPPSDVSVHSAGPGRPLMGGSSAEKRKFSLNRSNTNSGDTNESALWCGRSKKNLNIGNSGGSVSTATTPSDAHTVSMQSLSLSVSKKSNSLPPNASIHDVDPVMASALRISPEELANQITVLDFPSFAAIQPDELTSCAWTKKNKHVTTPNIVAFTKRFNHTSFWTVQEILGGNTPKVRAEILAHFIRVAKKLHELNNLHSLFAIISAMQSASIYRLSRTWSCLSKKERATFDRLADIFNDKDNWSMLREYLESLKLPCIPYIGLFLTDLVYIDLAYPHKGGGLEPEQRTTQMNNILRVIANYQNSDYSCIIPVPNIQKYLQSVRYIEELQNIFEEDQYKKSLKLEPANGTGSTTTVSHLSNGSSKESIAHGQQQQLQHHQYTVDQITLDKLNLSPAKSVSSMRSSSSVSGTSKFIPGHRKCRSLGTNIFKTGQVGIVNGSVLMGSSNNGNSGNNNTIHGSGVLSSTDLNARHLLDDSVIEDNVSVGKHHGALDTHSTTSSEGTSMGLNGVGLNDGHVMMMLKEHDGLDFQGSIRRKTLLKDGRKPAVASWQRYWLQIWANSLVYFPPKTFKGNERSDFKREPCKVCPLEGWCVEQLDTVHHANTFQLVNVGTNTVYKFRTSTQKMASLWIDVLHHIITAQRREKSLPVNLMTFE